MRVIILGTANCPHCHAIVKYLKAANDLVSYSYVDFVEFINTYLSESEREAYVRKLHTTPTSLPLAFYRIDSTASAPWKEFTADKFTKNLVVRYAKELVTNNGRVKHN